MRDKRCSFKTRTEKKRKMSRDKETEEDTTDMKEFISQMPKVELHLHLEGTLMPDLQMQLAERNGILDQMRFRTVQELEAAHNFSNLQEFLDLYYEGMQVLCTERDFFDLTWSYLERAHTNEFVRHAEVFFDPQAHTTRGIDFDVVVRGICGAAEEARSKWNMSVMIIPCFLRHEPVDSSMKILKEHLVLHKDKFVAVGLDSTELGNPMSKYQELFQCAREEGFLTVAHAGEEGPASNVEDALDLLQVRRIDHGVRCIEDPNLVSRLCREKIPLTVCPCSNVKLKIFDKMENHCIKSLLDRGVRVTVNSDDPAYFDAYITDNYLSVFEALNLTRLDIVKLVENSIEASFLNEEEKLGLQMELENFVATH